MDPRLDNLLDVASGARSLHIAVDMESVAMITLGVFVAVLLALFIAGFILT